MGRSLHAKLKTTFDGWNASNDDAMLVDEVAALAELFGKRMPADAGNFRLRGDDLELICFEYVSA